MKKKIQPRKRNIMSREAIEEAIEVLEDASAEMLMETGDKSYYVEAIAVLRQALETEKQEPVANEVQLNIIRYWPDDFAVRLESMWKDLIGFIPNYKLYDLQKMLAEFGFTMVLYEGNRPQAREWIGLTDEEIAREFYKFEAASAWYQFACAIEAKLKEKNT
jgi:uncharacterized protein YqgQ